MTSQPVPQILIVEDSDTQALQLRYLLEEEGWEVFRAASGEEALDELNRMRPGLIIADYHLPGIRGDEFCRRVRMNLETRGIPILMLTVEEGGEPASLDSGADDFVSKTVTPGILLVRVRALLRKSQSGSALLPSPEPFFHRARLLAIDDSPTYLELLAESLAAEGYDVTRASNGKAGLACARAQSFDCVLVDLVMPGMDGIEVCRQIQEIDRNHGSSVAVIMLTARETREDMTRGLEAGADDFVGKSSDMAVLQARIRALLRRKFYSDENRRIGEQLLRKELEVSHARAAQQLAETRASLAGELERKNKELEAFSYSVSHDLRAPLRSIAGFSTALLEDYAPNLDDRGRDYLNRVSGAAKRMGELIDDLLNLSRVGRAELQRRRVDLAPIAHRVIADLQGRSPDRHVRVVIPAEVPADADPRLLQAVLENLLGNAWKFTGKAADPVIEFAVDDQGVYFIRDNGAGFDMSYVEKLFAPFQRLHSEAQFPGTGIGLATVYRIIDRHGGRVWATGKPGEGATFYWTLPPQHNGVLHESA